MRLLSLVLVTLALSAAPRIAHADPKAEVKQKVKEAMENYDLMDYDAAKKQLNQALVTAKKSHIDSDAVVARVHIALAIVYFSGLQDQDAAKLEFLSAAQIDPKIQIDAAYKTPEMAKLLEQAKSEVGGGGAGNGGSHTTVAAGGGDDTEAAPTVDCSSITGLQHTILEDGVMGQAQRIDVALGPDVKAAKVSVMYRPEGQTDFTESVLSKNGCQYAGKIPSKGMKGSLVHYYVAAYDAQGKVIASKGSAGSPNIMELTAPKGGAAAGGGSPSDEEDPLNNGHKAEPEKTGSSGDDDTTKGGDVSASVEVAGKPSKVTIAVVVGTGLGYVTGTTEGGNTVKNCCIGSSVLVLTPELGYNISAATSISIAARLGLPVDATYPGHATLAPGFLLRLRHSLNASGDGLRVMGEVGGGYIRNTLKIDSTTAMTGMDTDIVAQGPLLLGGGIGYSHHFSHAVAFVADLSVLAGIPVVSAINMAALNFGITADVSIGFQVGF